MNNYICRGRKVIYEEHIWNIIREHCGAFNAINQYEIADKYMYWHDDGITERMVRRSIRKLRKEGYPILSTPHNPGGYFVPYSYKEVQEWRERMRKKAIKALAIINPVLKACDDMFPERGVGQLNLLEIEKVG